MADNNELKEMTAESGQNNGVQNGAEVKGVIGGQFVKSNVFHNLHFYLY